MLYPKIGIRPTIDGRWGGIRESLEAQTMGLAQAAQTLISSLRYPDGTPVQAVISPCTIGGGAEAARCEEYFATQNVIATLTVTPCWCYGMETFDMNPQHHQGGMGLQWHGAARRSVSGGSAGGTMPRRDCLPSAFTAGTFRTWGTAASPRMWRKRCCALPAAPWPWAG